MKCYINGNSLRKCIKKNSNNGKDTRKSSSFGNSENGIIDSKNKNFRFYKIFRCKSIQLIVDSEYCIITIKNYKKNRDKVLLELSKEFELKEYLELKTFLPITQLTKDSNEKVEILKMLHNIILRQLLF